MGNFTLDELMAVCVARQVENGDLLAQGIATPLVAAGYMLAKLTHAPDATFAAATGQVLCQEGGRIGLARAEDHWIGKGLIPMRFTTAVLELYPRTHPKEFFRPAQVDPAGNFNNIAIGKDYHKPRLRLPGTGGIPDLSVYADGMYLYVPRHSPVTFVERLDFLSGMGHHPDRRAGDGPRYLLSDLGQFDWEGGRMRLTSIHPGVEMRRIERKTAFEFAVAPDLHETPPPTPQEIRLLREEIDPLNVRRLETLGGSARRDLLREILAAEGAL